LSKEAIKERIHQVDYLRAIAVLGVCVLHFTVPTPIFYEYTFLRTIGAYGKYGVELFFLISGFIIPYSMYTKDYKYRDFGNFLTRRLIRIELPYLVSIIFVLVIGYLSTLHPLYKGVVFEIDLINLFYHLGYLNIFFENNWINPVYWTLAIEFHFYLTIAIVYPLLLKNGFTRFLVHLALLTPIFFISSFNIFRFYGYFLLGIMVFLYYVRRTSWFEFTIYLITLLIYVVYFRGWFNIIVIALFCAFTLKFVNIKSNVLGYLGKISFSLYLYHFVGNKFQNLVSNYTNDDGLKLLLIPGALVVSILLSHLFYQTVEVYSVNLSRRIKY
jgi:peptidoglycan/LPS O-acetylase OafA/YrhL